MWLPSAAGVAVAGHVRWAVGDPCWPQLSFDVFYLRSGELMPLDILLSAHRVQEGTTVTRKIAGLVAADCRFHITQSTTLL